MDDVIKFQATPNGDNCYAWWHTSQYRTDISDPDRWCAQVLEDFLACSGFNKERVIALLQGNRPTYAGSPDNPYR